MTKMDTAKMIFNPTGFLIESVIKSNVESFSDSSKESTLQKLKEDAVREEIKATVLQTQAKVEQELAIARRIDNAEEVEIEEFYDVSGKGNAGLKGTASGISVGAGGEGHKVTKRIIKFKGIRTNK